MRPTRRDMLKALAGSAGLAAVPGWLGRLLAEPTATGAPAATSPAAGAGGAAGSAPANIVFILCDDLGYGDVRCLNPDRGKIPTPHIDKLASQGLTFTDAHSASAVCTPTRYGILTGRYPWRSRLQSGVLDSDAEPLIAPGRLTVPALLGRGGYHTACIGKWHLGYHYDRGGDAGGGGAGADDDADAAKQAGKKGADKKGAGKKANTVPVGARLIGGPTTRGFDMFFGFHHARSIQLLAENDRVIEHIAPVDMLPRLTARAVDYIAQRAAQARPDAPAATRKPFFLYLPLNSPHTPIVPAPAWKGRSGLGDYADYVMQTDAAVGEVLAALDRHGLADNTLVFFASDNGCSPAAGIDKLERQGHYPSGAFRGHKADIWDGGHRIPFIARWPGRIRAGTTSRQLVCLNDLMATCADLLGDKLPDNAGEDSVSLLPALLGRDTPPLREAVVHASISGRFAIRQGNWKLELCAGSGGWSQPGEKEAAKENLPAIQLYDMTADVGERKNLQAERPEVVQRLTGLLEKYVADGRSTPGLPQKNDVAVDIWKKSRAGAGRKK